MTVVVESVLVSVKVVVRYGSLVEKYVACVEAEKLIVSSGDVTDSGVGLVDAAVDSGQFKEVSS